MTTTDTGFGAVDAHPDGASLVAALDIQASLPAIKRLRTSAVELLAPAPGGRLLDAGCGTGDMTRRLAAAVAPGGSVVGVDASETMLAEAERRSTDATLTVELCRGDITCLDLPDGSFDGAYSERVFQHLDRPEVALAALVRVTRPGGRIAVIDSDWGMHAIHGADPQLTNRVITCWADQIPNGWSGRRLPGLFAATGMTDACINADTLTVRDARLPAMEPFATMASVAQGTGALTDDEARRWLQQLAQASTAGSFFWAITLFLVVGTRVPTSAN